MGWEEAEYDYSYGPGYRTAFDQELVADVVTEERTGRRFLTTLLCLLMFCAGFIGVRWGAAHYSHRDLVIDGIHIEGYPVQPPLWNELWLRPHLKRALKAQKAPR